MSKLCLIATFFQAGFQAAFRADGQTAGHTSSLPVGSFRRFFAMSIVALAAAGLPGSLSAQEPNAGESPQYPKAVTVGPGGLFAIDLDLPGVWAIDDATTLFAKGSNLLRKPMNRPHCGTPHPAGGILVGDSATREVYWIESSGAEPKPLTGGRIGIPMALAVDPEGKFLYVGDAEKMATFRLPLEGGDPELVARVNARGLAFDDQGRLLAVTPDKEAIRRINVANNEVEILVDDRPFQFPNGLCWAGDHGYVTDTYSNAIWKFTSDGQVEKWFEGDPLQRPVGIAVAGQSLFVADPKQKQIFEFDLQTKQVKPRM